MKKPSRIIVVVMLCTIGGCETPLVTSHLPVSVVDQVTMHRFEVSYRNNTDKGLCMAVEDWPFEGMVQQGGNHIILVAGGEKFAIEDINTGYCIGNNCTTRIAPGEEIKGWISYGSFKLPERLWEAPKTLNFSPPAYSCKRVKVHSPP